MTFAHPRLRQLVLSCVGALALSTSAVHAQNLGFGPPQALNSNAYNLGGGHEHPVLAAVGGNAWVAAWDSDSTLDYTLGRDHDILFARSTDGGVSWAFPEPLNSDAAIDSGLEDERPALSTDGAGNVVAAWIRRVGNDAFGATLLVARSTDGGATWSAALPLSTDQAAAPAAKGEVALDFGADGVFVAVWRRSDSGAPPVGGKRLLSARSSDLGATWTPPAPATGPDQEDKSAELSSLSLATDRAGVWIAAWESYEPIERPIPIPVEPRWVIRASRSLDNGATWEETGGLREWEPEATFFINEAPALATDRAGGWLAAWNDGRFRRLARSLDNGATWFPGPSIVDARDEDDPSRACVVQGGTIQQRSAPVMAMDGAGRGVILSTLVRLGENCCWNGFTWVCMGPGSTLYGAQTLLSGGGASGVSQTSNAGFSTELAIDEAAGVWLAVEEIAPYELLRVRRSLSAGQGWSAGTFLNIDGLHEERPAADAALALAANGDGTMVALWESRESVDHFSASYDVLQATSTDNGATWSEARLAFPHQSSSPTRPDRFPSVAADGQGVWAAVWSAGGISGHPQQHDAYLARSTDKGATWEVGAKLSAATSPGVDLAPKIATDREGVWIALWSSKDLLPDAAPGDPADIQYARSVDHAQTWSAPRTLDASGRHDDGHAIAAGGEDVWVAAWRSGGANGGELGDIVAARSDDGGATWGAPATLSLGGSQEDAPENGRAAVATNRAGRWVIAWPSADRAGGPLGADSDILVVHSADNALTWSEPAPLHWDAFIDQAPESWSDDNVSLAFAPDGSCMATWRKAVEGANGRGLVAVARSLDGGATWSSTGTASGVFPNGPNPDAVLPVAIAGAEGRWLVAWPSEDDPNENVLDDLDLFYSFSDALAEQSATLSAMGFSVR